ncbi:sensor histidine kinase [Tenacibaculum sp. nBUS_03]|uniref:sensor histidine kinase n=1 Tax=Tenacibaculum sp. nBUS_03 TaxID=3395320 RepID=UPI003EC15420
MEKENQILDILRLYEYSMSLGKSLDYYENCDQFLKLLLKRLNLNACWVINNKEGDFVKEYSVPFGNQINQKLSPKVKDLIYSIEDHLLLKYENLLHELSPIKINQGFLVIFRLNVDSFLFLYSKNNDINERAMSQLSPVINKFSITLEACNAHSNQKSLLKKLENRNKELNNYAHIVSHDLKSPLRNINALTSWLKEDHANNLNDEAIKYINLISDNITKMESLVSGILEYSTIDLKGFKTSFIDLNTLINEILDHIYVPKNIKITVYKNFPIIHGDRYRLQQLFQNLINNSIKYNDKENGIIEIGFTKNNDQTQYFVKDNGKGIDQKYHTKIFDIFQKLENTKNSTGIGLSIVKKIITDYGGRIWLTSEVGKGTTFFFTLKT